MPFPGVGGSCPEGEPVGLGKRQVGWLLVEGWLAAGRLSAGEKEVVSAWDCLERTEAASCESEHTFEESAEVPDFW